jgi:hypothetical protein
MSDRREYAYRQIAYRDGVEISSQVIKVVYSYHVEFLRDIAMWNSLGFEPSPIGGLSYRYLTSHYHRGSGRYVDDSEASRNPYER